jgi:hypothetical protein
MQSSYPTLKKPLNWSRSRIVLQALPITWRQVSLCFCKPNWEQTEVDSTLKKDSRENHDFRNSMFDKRFGRVTRKEYDGRFFVERPGTSYD